MAEGGLPAGGNAPAVASSSFRFCPTAATEKSSGFPATVASIRPPKMARSSSTALRRPGISRLRIAGLACRASTCNWKLCAVSGTMRRSATS